MQWFVLNSLLLISRALKETQVTYNIYWCCNTCSSYSIWELLERLTDVVMTGLNMFELFIMNKQAVICRKLQSRERAKSKSLHLHIVIQISNNHTYLSSKNPLAIEIFCSCFCNECTDGLKTSCDREPCWSMLKLSLKYCPLCMYTSFM